MSEVLARIGRLDEALAEFNEELKISPNDAMTEFFLGDIYLQQDNVEQAQQCLERALAVQPGLVEAEVDMAKAYHRQNKIAEAVQLLKKVIASDPDQQDAHYLLFSLYKEQGETEQARKELATFEELKRKAADQDQKRMRMDSLN